MNTSNPKTKLTVSIDKDVLMAGKKAASERRIPVSRLIENYLKFVAKPEIYCFKCGKNFSVNEAEVCPRCGWIVCVKCNACRCILSEESAEVAYHMRKVYEDLLGGRIK